MKFERKALSVAVIFMLIVSLISPATTYAEEPLPQSGTDSIVSTSADSVTIEVNNVPVNIEEKLLKTVQYLSNHAPMISSASSYTGLDNETELLLGLKGAGVDIASFNWNDMNSPFDEGMFWSNGTFTKTTAGNRIYFNNALLGALVLGLNPHNKFSVDLVHQLADGQYRTSSTAGQFHSTENRTIKNNVRTLLALNSSGVDRATYWAFDENLTLEYLLSRQFKSKTNLFGTTVADNGWAFTLLGQYDLAKISAQLKETATDDWEWEWADSGKISAAVEALKENPELIKAASVEELARLITGLVAINEDAFSTTWPLGDNGELMSIATYFAQQQQADGSFGSEEDTVAALIALGDLQAGKTIYERLKTLKNITKTVELVVEGSEKTLYNDMVTVTNYPQVTIADVVKEAVPAIDLTERAGNAKWYYTTDLLYVKDDFSADAENGSLVVYYGAKNAVTDEALALEDITFTNKINITTPTEILAGEPFNIQVTASYNHYDRDGKIVTGGYEVEQKLAGATVVFNGETYTTNVDGIVQILGEKAQVGEYELQVSKDIEGSYPRMLRQAKKIIVQEDETPTKDIRIVVEGPDKKLHDVTVTIKGNKTVLDATVKAFDEQHITYDLTKTTGIVKSIAEIEQGTFQGWDGWNYTTNNLVYSTNNPNEQSLEGIEEIIWYYGAEGDLYQGLISLDDNMTLKPFITVEGEAKQGKDLTLHVTGQHRLYDMSWNLVQEKVIANLVGATVTYNGKQYVTDVAGKVVIPGAEVQQTVAVEVSHYIENSYPRVVRTDFDIAIAPDYRIMTEQAIEKAKSYIEQNPQAISTRVNESHSGYWMLSAMAGLNIDIENYAWTVAPTAENTFWSTAVDASLKTANEELGAILGARILQLDATNLKGRNIVEDLLARKTATGLYSTLYGEPWAMVALTVEAPAAYEAQAHYETLLAQQNKETGLIGSTDLTGWALIALAPYKEQPQVQQAIEKAVAALHNWYEKNGPVDNANTMAAIIHGLGAVGEDLFTDKWTVEKDGKQQNIVGYVIENYQLVDGSFKWRTVDRDKINVMATEQLILALADAYAQSSTFVRLKEKLDEQPTVTEPEKNSVTMRIAISDEEVILPTEAFDITADETAYSLLKRITLQKQIALDDRTTDMGAYIAGIAGVKEFDFGPASGWMYLVNGEAPEVSADSYVLQPNDEIKWLYTKDLGEDVTAEKTSVTVRVEAHDKTILYEQVQLNAYDISTVVENSNVPTAGTPYAIHALLKAFEQAGYGVTEQAKFSVGVNDYGIYVSKLAGLAATATGGWMFAVNDTSPSEGLGSYALQNNDEVVVYFVEDWTSTNYSYLKLHGTENNAYKIQLLALGYDENWNTIKVPVSDATIVIDGAESTYKTDAEGFANVQFITEGKHELTAVKKVGEYNSISRPYLVINVNKEGLVTPKPTPVDPAPVDPAPVDPAPVDPAPVDPAPVDPAPVDPAPVDPAPVDPAPVDPAPVDPAPVDPAPVTSLVQKVTTFLVQKTPVAAFGSEWTIISLARSGATVPQSYYDNYLANVANALKETNGTLEGPLTEHSRLILALSAIGVDAKNVGGYNVYAPLHDFDKVIAQGINGSIFALLAFDAQNYHPTVAQLNRVASLTDVAAITGTTREKLVEHIVNSELAGGGFALSGTKVDPDVTAMALQALAPYKADEKVAKVIERGVAQLASIQLANAGYSSAGSENVQSAAQVLIALSTLKIDAAKDERFIKNGQTILSNIETYTTGDGSYKHPKNGSYNAMATAQATQALVAYDRFVKGLSGLFEMADVAAEETPIPVPTPTPGTGGTSSGSGGAVTPTVPTEQVAYIAITNKSYGDILAETEVKLNKGDTVFSILKRVTDAKGITLNTRTSSYGKYIVGIAGIKEFDKGPLSGWMYRTNGDFPSYSADSHTVKAGDSIEWVYTEDLGKDVGGYVEDTSNQTVAGGAGGGQAIAQKPVEQVTTEQGTTDQATTNSNETLQVKVTAVQIAVLKNAPLVLTSEAGKVEIPAALLKALQLKENETLNIAVTQENKQIQVTLEKEADGKKTAVAAGKNYVKVTLPGALANTVVQQVVDGELKAVPHKVVNGDFVLFVKASGTFVMSEEAVTFNDIAKLANKEDIEFLASRLVIKGKEDGVFAPSENVTRAQFAAMVSRALGLQATEPSSFTDTKGKWYEADVQALFEAGITTGKTANTFDPGAKMTREQGAAFMARILTYAGYEAAPVNEVTFKDEASINKAYKENIALLVELGIISGKEDGTFDAKGNLTRGQLAKMLKRTLTISGLM